MVLISLRSSVFIGPPQVTQLQSEKLSQVTAVYVKPTKVHREGRLQPTTMPPLINGRTVPSIIASTRAKSKTIFSTSGPSVKMEAASIDTTMFEQLQQFDFVCLKNFRNSATAMMDALEQQVSHITKLNQEMVGLLTSLINLQTSQPWSPAPSPTSTCSSPMRREGAERRWIRTAGTQLPRLSLLHLHQTKEAITSRQANRGLRRLPSSPPIHHP